jgi:hypothetical protein
VEWLTERRRFGVDFMTDKEKDDYVVLFRGAKLSEREANKVGLGLLCGFIGSIIYILTYGSNKFLGALIAFVCAFIGYFVLGNRIVKK